MTKLRKPSFDLHQFLSSIGPGRTITKYKRNKFVFRQGRPCDSVFYILSGQCKITVLSHRGKEAVVAIQGEGDFIGEGCLNGQPLRLATATTLTDCEIMRFEKDTIGAALKEHSEFASLFMTHLLTRNTRAEADLVDQLFNSSEKRLARVLLLMANFGKEGAPQALKTNISQETLAVASIVALPLRHDYIRVLF